LKAELSGDAIHVELVEPSAEAPLVATLAAVPAVREVTVTGVIVRARADHGGAAVPAMITALEASGAKVASVRVTRPSLDDVYLRHTGRTFSEAEGNPA
jgi:ABC-2 type transport system ATP-binding protein